MASELSPADNTPINTTPINTTPINTTPADNTPINTTPINTTPGDNTPIDLPSPAATDLRSLLRSRLERHVDTQGFQPALTIVGFRGDQSDILRRGVDHPEDAVLEFLLPPEYGALGVLASSIVASPPRRDHRNAALAIGVSRAGHVVSLLATADEVIDTNEPQGWLIDACLRALGQSTPPCTVASLAFPVALWLDRLMVAILAASSSEPMNWPSAVDLCPIPRRWRSTDPIDLGTTLGSTTRSWKALRSAVVRGQPTAVAMSPERAEWMDDAMFARWCMGSFPDLASLRGDVEFLAPDDIAECIELALRAAWSAFGG